MQVARHRFGVKSLPQLSLGERMTTFDKREEGFEKKFAHDEELRFKANARRNKLLGLWAAEKLGISGTAADVYRGRSGHLVRGQELRNRLDLLALPQLGEADDVLPRALAAGAGDRLLGGPFSAVFHELPSRRPADLRRHLRGRPGAPGGR